MKQSSSRYPKHAVMVVPLLLTLALASLLWTINDPHIIIQSSSQQQQQQVSALFTTTDDDWPPMELIEALWKSQPNDPSHLSPRRELVVAASSGAYADMATNFAHSLLHPPLSLPSSPSHHQQQQSHHVRNFVLVPLDALAYRILHERFPHHTLPLRPSHIATTDPSNNSHTAAIYGSPEFRSLTSTRPLFLMDFLRKNITIFYNDIDTVWQYNAWDAIDRLKQQREQEPQDSQEPSNKPSNKPPLDVLLWRDGNEQICTCFIYMVPSNTSYNILNGWYEEIQTVHHSEDQRALNVMSEMNPTLISDHTQVQVMYNSELFPTGGMFAWGTTPDPPPPVPQSSSSSKDNVHPKYHSISLPESEAWTVHGPTNGLPTNPSRAILIHNNWIVGYNAKKERFVQSNLWRADSY